MFFEIDSNATLQRQMCALSGLPAPELGTSTVLARRVLGLTFVVVDADGRVLTQRRDDMGFAALHGKLKPRGLDALRVQKGSLVVPLVPKDDALRFFGFPTRCR